MMMNMDVDVKANIIHFKGMELSGRVFNSMFHHMTFIKLTNENEYHNNFKFKDGMNIDHRQFSPNGSCQAGGIYFTNIDDAWRWIYYSDNVNVMRYMRLVVVPYDARVYIDDGKLKADKLILNQRENIRKEIYLEAIKREYCNLKQIPDFLRDREICLEAVKRHGATLYYVPNNLKDKQMCTEAIKQNGYAIQDVPDDLKDKEMCLIAVRKYGNVLKFIPDFLKDTEICLEAVKCGCMLQYVPESLRLKIYENFTHNI